MYIGLYRLWALVGSDLHQIKLVVPRVFYVNQRTPKQSKQQQEDEGMWRKVQKTLPRSHPALNLYEYRVPEEVFRKHASDLVTDLSTPDVEGIYETQVPLDFRAMVDLGCLCAVDKHKARQLASSNPEGADTFELSWLQFKTLATYHYLPQGSYKTVYLYQHKCGNKSIYGLFVPATKKASVFAVDTVRSNQMPNLNNLYNNERSGYLNRHGGLSSSQEEEDLSIPEESYSFEVRVETEVRQVHRQLSKLLAAYKEEKRGPTVVVTQTLLDFQSLLSAVPSLADFPAIPIHVSDPEGLYGVLDWQRVGVKAMMRHFFKSDSYLQATVEQCRYFHVPAGNLPRDSTAFGADLFYARHLRKQNFVLWCSPTDRPDLGGTNCFANFESFYIIFTHFCSI